MYIQKQLIFPPQKNTTHINFMTTIQQKITSPMLLLQSYCTAFTGQTVNNYKVYNPEVGHFGQAKFINLT